MGGKSVHSLDIPRRLLSNNLILSAVILIVVFIVAIILIPAVLQPTNLLNVLRMNSISGIAAVGITLVLLSGEIDLSVGSILSMSLVIGGLCISLGSIPAFIITLLTGAALGFINGIIVVKGKIPSLMVTLGMLSVYGGLANVLSNGQAIYLYESALYLEIGQGNLFSFPNPAIIFFIIVIIFSIVSYKTKFGKRLYYTGANQRAAVLSGIKADGIKIMAFSLCGLCVAVAGPLLASQTHRIIPTIGAGYELTAIAVAVLGGTTFGGGKGSVVGTLLGTLTLGFLLNALSLSGIGTYAELVLKGVLVIGIVMIFEFANRRLS